MYFRKKISFQLERGCSISPQGVEFMYESVSSDIYGQNQIRSNLISSNLSFVIMACYGLKIPSNPILRCVHNNLIP
jgi:hypothetical protein